MGVDPILTPLSIRKLISNEEVLLRSNMLARDTVQIIFRYGFIVGSTIEQHRILPRGMDRARSLISQHEESGKSFPSGMIIIADAMSGSKGRFQRSWHAPPGGLWLTLIIVNTLLPTSTLLYPLAAGAACCEALRHFGINARIKWVNDLHVNGKKIGGILAETLLGRLSGEEYILLGMGININNDSFPPELAKTATSMKTLSGRNDWDVKNVAARLLAKLAWHIGVLHYEEQRQLLRDDGIDSILADIGHGEEYSNHLLLEQWRVLSDTVGRRVKFGYDVQEKPQYEGTVLGVDGAGGLILRLEDGHTVVENSGEILYLE